ncbi:hypothetical protein R0J90_13095, partial [Micrococcus sp. SIMBA_144]
MIDELGINTQWRANQAAVAMEAYKNRFLRAIDLMNARKTQSQGLIDLLPETSNIQAVDEAFLSVGDALERMAKRGTAANLAISMLGRNASMYDLNRM